MKLVRLLIFLIILSIETSADDRAQECTQAFSSHQEFTNAPINTRTYNTFKSMTPECQDIILALPDFRSTLNEVIVEYESSITHNLTVDTQIYFAMNKLIERSVSREIKTKIDQNKQEAGARCGGTNSKDFRDKLPPIRNQGSIGWCYAYTVADLVSFYSGKNISARHIAQTNNLAVNQETLAYGLYNSIASMIGEAPKSPLHLTGEDVTTIRSSFRSLQTPTRREGEFEKNAFLRTRARGGFCLESDLPSDNFNEQNLGEVIELFNSFDQQEIDENNHAQSFCREHLNIIKHYFPNNFNENILDTLIKGNQQGDSFFSMSQGQCNEVVSLDSYLTHTHLKYEDGDIIKGIDAKLNSDEIISVNYDTSILGQPRSQDNPESHSSNVVGRKFDQENGRCQYLIRNSWGSDCSLYPASANVTCEDGHLWVYEDELDRHSYSAMELYK